MSEDTHPISPEPVYAFSAPQEVDAPIKLGPNGFLMSHCIIIGGENGPMVHVSSGAPFSTICNCTFIMSSIPKWYQLIRWGWLIRRLYEVRWQLRQLKRTGVEWRGSMIRLSEKPPIV